jgi:hypothetical protein
VPDGSAEASIASTGFKSEDDKYFDKFLGLQQLIYFSKIREQTNRVKPEGLAQSAGGIGTISQEVALANDPICNCSK